VPLLTNRVGIGAGSRGAGGGKNLEIFWPPWELYSEPSKRSWKSAKTFFLENAYFWDKNAVQSHQFGVPGFAPPPVQK